MAATDNARAASGLKSYIRMFIINQNSRLFRNVLKKKKIVYKLFYLLKKYNLLFFRYLVFVRQQQNVFSPKTQQQFMYFAQVFFFSIFERCKKFLTCFFRKHYNFVTQ